MLKLDSNLSLDRCPHCNIASPSLSNIYHKETTNHSNQNLRMWRIYVCGNCGGVVSAASSSGLSGDVIEYYPKSQTIDESIPNPAIDYLIQAFNCMHAPAGCIMLCASCVDSMLKLKGYDKGTLLERINNAATDHLITNGIVEWFHEVRLNVQEQGTSEKESKLPTEDDAKKTLDFVSVLSEFLFVLPSRIQKGMQ